MTSCNHYGCLGGGALLGGGQQQGGLADQLSASLLELNLQPPHACYSPGLPLDGVAQGYPVAGQTSLAQSSPSLPPALQLLSSSAFSDMAQQLAVLQALQQHGDAVAEVLPLLNLRNILASSSLNSELLGLKERLQQAASPAGGLAGAPAASGASPSNPLYKTELCRSWEETGSCRYGGKCQFAHGREELRPVVRHPRYKTEVCRTFSTTGTCPYGTRCRFIHPSNNLKTSPPLNPSSTAAPDSPQAAAPTSGLNLGPSSFTTPPATPRGAPSSGGAPAHVLSGLPVGGLRGPSYSDLLAAAARLEPAAVGSGRPAAVGDPVAASPMPAMDMGAVGAALGRLRTALASAPGTPTSAHGLPMPMVHRSSSEATLSAGEGSPGAAARRLPIFTRLAEDALPHHL